MKRVPVTCNRDCGGGCPLLATIEDGSVVRIAPNPAGGPFLKGCPRGYQAMRQLYAADRLTTPLLRDGPRGSGRFRAATWNEALDAVAAGLRTVREDHGDGAVLALGGSGSCRGALHNTGALMLRFLNLCGGCVSESNTYSSAAAQFTERVVLGTRESGSDAATLAHAQMILLWGSNLFDTIMGCEWRSRIAGAKARGVPVVVIDPRNTETAKRLGTEWLSVRPGTDSALMLAVLHVLVTDDLVDEGYVATHATGFEDLRRRVLGQESGERAAEGPSALAPGQASTPTWAEGVCGVPAARIVALAREYARRKPAALVPGLSIQRTRGGEEAVRLAIALQVATGNLGVPGGSSGGQQWGGLPDPQVGRLDELSHPASTAIAANDWANAVLTGRAGGYPTDIAAVYNVGGNYAAQAADAAKAVRALRAVEFSVCHELFMTATARECDVVLPTTHWLERADIVFGSGNYVLFSHKVAEPPGREGADRGVAPGGVAGSDATGARDDYAIFADLAGRLGFGAAFTQGRDEQAWLRSFVDGSPIADDDEFRRTGVWFGSDQLRVAFRDFADDPARHPLQTPSGKVELAGTACAAAGLPVTPDALVPARRGDLPLLLVTPKSRFRVHSQLDDLPWFRERDDRTLWVNSADAAARGLADGGPVRVISDRGELVATCRVTGDVMPGVVSLLEGIEPDWQGGDPGVTGRAAARNGAANVLTADEPCGPSRGAAMHGVPVEIEPA